MEVPATKRSRRRWNYVTHGAGSRYAILMTESTCNWLNHVYDRYTKYRKDYAILGETLTYAQFKKQLRHSDYYLDSNVLKRMGSDVRKVWLLNYELLSVRCDVSGFQITEVEPLK